MRLLALSIILSVTGLVGTALLTDLVVLKSNGQQITYNPRFEDTGSGALEPGFTITVPRSLRVNDRRIAILRDDWYACYYPTSEVFLVPENYVTDFASIPPGLTWLLDEFGNNAEAAILHDWLYAIGEVGQRQKADRVFYYMLKEQNVSVLIRTLMYWGVRAGGNEAYGRDDEWRFRESYPPYEEMTPAFAKPSASAITNVDCIKFHSPSEQDRVRQDFSYQ